MVETGHINSAGPDLGFRTRALVVTGTLSARTGGPLVTIANLSQALRNSGMDTTVMAIAKSPLMTDITEIDGALTRNRLTAWATEYWRRSRGAAVVVVVGVWHPVFAMVALMALFRRTRLVLVPTNSLMPWDWAKHAKLKRFLRPMLWLIGFRFAAVVTASSGERDESWPKTFRRSVRIPHAVPDLPDLGSAPDRENVVVYAGRVHPQKDLPLLFKSLSLLSPRLKLRICGDGDPAYRAELERLGTSLELDIEWLGWMSRDDVLREMRRAAAVAITSQSENFCHAAAEAASLGVRVVIVDRVASASDLAESPLIQAVPATPQSIAAAIQESISRPSNDTEIAAGQDWAKSNWSLDAHARQWMALLASFRGEYNRGDVA